MKKVSSFAERSAPLRMLCNFSGVSLMSPNDSAADSVPVVFNRRSRLLPRIDDAASAVRPIGGAPGGTVGGPLGGAVVPDTRRGVGGSVPETSPESLGVRLFDLAVLMLEELESRERVGGGQSFQPSIKSPR